VWWGRRGAWESWWCRSRGLLVELGKKNEEDEEKKKKKKKKNRFSQMGR